MAWALGLIPPKAAVVDDEVCGGEYRVYLYIPGQNSGLSHVRKVLWLEAAL